MHVSEAFVAFSDFAYSENQLRNNVVSLVAATSWMPGEVHDLPGWVRKLVNHSSCDERKW